MQRTVSIIVMGRVQGVFFRQSTREKAVSLGIKGEVRNMPDDTVHIVVTGSSEKLQELITWCHQGPSRAKVTDVRVEEVEDRSFEKFTIER
ncbi:MAG: acylphosphatase [Chitinophagaceae bacterium]|nr:acylphosphatase [Chitinophagaceae bacterium]